MFVDLASFTPLAEAMGDLRAAAVLDRFAEIVRKAVQRCHGRIVKQIGDAFMIVFPECYSAVSCGARGRVQRRARSRSSRRCAIGLHWGSLLYREGDYVGSNVNIASRLAREAHRHQFLVTSEVRRRAKDLRGRRVRAPRQAQAEGPRREVEVFEAKAAGPRNADRA